MRLPDKNQLLANPYFPVVEQNLKSQGVREKQIGLKIHISSNNVHKALSRNCIATIKNFNTKTVKRKARVFTKSLMGEGVAVNVFAMGVNVSADFGQQVCCRALTPWLLKQTRGCTSLNF